MRHRSTDRIDLSGRWRFGLDRDGVGDPDRDLTGTITLPGTTDEAGKGQRATERAPDHLTRRHRYEGVARYRRIVDVPSDWERKRIVLHVERTRPLEVRVDGTPVGEGESLSTPQTYDLTDHLDPGAHTLTLRIDTASEPITLPGVQRSHAATEHTQTNWNGVIGDLALFATDRVWIDDCQVYPDPAAGSARVELTVGNRTAGPVEGSIRLSAAHVDGTHTVEATTESISVDGESATVTVDYDLEDPRTWDEFDPNVYELAATLEARSGSGEYSDALRTTFGVRSFERAGTQFSVNGRRTFLRGNVDCCVFPETGYPPTDVASWRERFETAREYGLNHYRFHSWCPPEAAFRAADELGLYLQVELPLWNSESAFETKAARAFYRAEAERILDAYGNHPSFVAFALGNELVGETAAMGNLVETCRERDPRHCYACGSYNDLDDGTLTAADDYWVTASVPTGSADEDAERTTVRGGAIDESPPATTTDYRAAVEAVPVPIVAHEIGQYQTYPDFAGLDRYDGVLAPWNLELNRDHLEAHGLVDRAGAFAEASGKLAVRCYREEIESALRTPGFGGFQLLGLEDFPGQGTALVGVLDSFFESKGLIEPAEWRSFCDASVPLVRLETRTFAASETLTADVQLAHYGPESHDGVTAEWTLAVPDETGRAATVAEGRLPATDVPQGDLVDLGELRVDLSTLASASGGPDAPTRLILSVTVEATDATTEYDLWVYPPDLPAVDAASGPYAVNDSHPDESGGDSAVVVRRVFDDQTREYLEAGANVLLLPEHETLRHSVRSAFAPCFWSYALFKRNAPAETLGPICEPDQPPLAGFPTADHGDWQWWHLLSNARPIVLGDAPDEYDPLIGMVDNVERNRKLGLVFETAVGEGNLLVCTVDLFAAADDPTVRAFAASLRAYAASESFDPDEAISAAVLEKLLTI